MSDKPKGVYCPKFEKGYWAGWDDHAKCGGSAEIPPLKLLLSEVVVTVSVMKSCLVWDEINFAIRDRLDSISRRAKAAIAETPRPTEGSEDRGT